MSRKVRRAIPVIDRTSVNALDEWRQRGIRLYELDPAGFAQLSEAAAALIAVHDQPDEPEAEFHARLRSIESKARLAN